MIRHQDYIILLHLYAAFAILNSSISHAAPFLLTDIIPPIDSFQEYDLHPIDSNELNPHDSSSWDENNYVDPELLKIFKGDDSNTIQKKRSGLRSALVARMNRGFSPPVAPMDNDVNSNYVSNIGNHVFYAQPSTMEGNYISRRSQPENIPYLSVGKMSGAKDDLDKNINSNLNYGIFNDVNRYFKGLQHQLENLVDEPEAAPVSIPGKSSRFFGVSRGGPRPAATAAYLHALRSHGPSHRIRSFVEDPGPLNLRGANNHDPALLWTGLGRRR